MSEVDVAGRLGAMNEAWQGAPEEGGSKPPPPGVYQAKIDRFDFFESKRDGHLNLVTDFVVTVGEHAGLKAPTFHDLEDPDRLGWAKGHLARLGIEDVEDLSTLPERLQAVLDTPCEIAVKEKTKDGETYSNTFLNRVLGEPGSGA